jgi:hypothetical protein
MRLGVIDKSTDALVSVRRSLTRNVIKIAVPWELGHTVALGYVSTASAQRTGLVVGADRDHLWLAAPESDLVDHSLPEAAA